MAALAYPQSLVPVQSRTEGVPGSTAVREQLKVVFARIERAVRLPPEFGCRREPG